MMRRCCDVDVRTTVNLPDDLHQQIHAISRDTHRAFSATIADLLRAASLGQGDNAGAVSQSAKTSLPVVTIGTVITSEEVRSLDDEA